MQSDPLAIARRRIAELAARTYQQYEINEGNEESPPRCLIAGCPTPASDIAYCPTHRRMADDGSLWLRSMLGETTSG